MGVGPEDSATSIVGEAFVVEGVEDDDEDGGADEALVLEGTGARATVSVV